MIRALIVDDEPLARRGVRARLESEPDFEVVGEAEDGPQAIEAIQSLGPAVVFLDVQMPGSNGFEVLRAVPAKSLPLVVFITAFDAHALQAFEIHALDFLLKPYSVERFQDCLAHVRAAIAHGETEAELARVRELLQQVDTGGADRYPRRFAVRERDRVVLIDADDLEAVVAASNYVQLIVPGRTHLLRLTLAEMERQLDPLRFTRIHRTTIVNIERMREIETDSHGSGTVRSVSGATYRMSRSYRDRLIPKPR